ncbi:MAG TPA: restriction endonuclease subunit S [Rhodanobacteraceae bacterium]
MHFPRYPKYKPSGVEWLGEVPTDWKVTRLKRVVALVTDRAEQRTNPVALENIDGWSGRFIPTETEFQGEGVAFEAGDILFGKLRPYLAKVFLADRAGEAVGDFHVLRPSTVIAPHFAQLQMLTRAFIDTVDGSTFGSKMPRASWAFLGTMPFVLPPVEEQSAIAAFLDRETGKIDALVAEQEKLIALLKEKRQALISHAVTRGINPDAPMKPSGIDWLGDVPAHWEVRRLRTLANVTRGASPRPAGSPEYFDGDFIPWVTVAEITKDDSIDLMYTAESLTQAGMESSRLFRAGTVIYSNSGATLGVPKILCMDACANDGVVAFEDLSSNVRPKFLYQLLASLTSTIREMVKQGSGQPNLNTDIVKSIRMALPPIGDQMAIVTEIERLSRASATLQDEATRAIALLKERRAALISAAVTGKIDVHALG